MSPAARVGGSLVLAVVVCLQATPSAALGEVRSSARRCEIAGSVAPITFFALPSKRSGSAIDPRGVDRMPPAPFTVAGDAFVPYPGARRLGTAATCGGEERARARMRCQRSRSPNDPEPS